MDGTLGSSQLDTLSYVPSTAERRLEKLAKKIDSKLHRERTIKDGDI